ncbi:TOBE domain-containing protein [Hymenobacter caeli]
MLQAVVEDIGARLGITCLLVSHDATDTLPWADEILVLRGGRLVQQGPPERIYRQPVDEYTAGLFGDYSLVRGADRRALGATAGAGPALLVRPEEFAVGPAGGGLAGTVRAVRFLGGYYELEIALPQSTVRARAAAAAFAPGDIVGVALAAGAGWALP